MGLIAPFNQILFNLHLQIEICKIDFAKESYGQNLTQLDQTVNPISKNYKKIRILLC